MCGIVGLFSPKEDVAPALLEALTVIQHRGQDAAGMATFASERLFLRKANGLVREAILPHHIQKLQGAWGIGHVRYPTAGSASEAEAQPFYVNAPHGIALAHNGNLTNAAELCVALRAQKRHINTESDSELLLNVFANALDAEEGVEPAHIFAAIESVQMRCEGAFSVVILIAGVGLVAFRDGHGIRPLVLASKETEKGPAYLLTSESAAADVLGFSVEGSVAPGEALFINMQGEMFRQQTTSPLPHYPCLFEFVYLARPDSVIDGACVYTTRLNMGERLAKQIQARGVFDDLDVVIPVPDTSRTAALQLAKTLQVDYREGFVKNRYIGRTFIMPGQQQRKRSVRQKLNTIAAEFAGKVVLLVDDSIVRGTTSEQLVTLARVAGAKKVYFASAAPPVRHANVYGIDIPATESLIAHGLDEGAIAEKLGVDGLVYQTLEDLKEAVQNAYETPKTFEDSVFSGEYRVGDINDEYLDALASQREARKDSPQGGSTFLS